MLIRPIEPQDERTLLAELRQVGVDEASYPIFLAKRSGLCVKVTGAPQPAAAILKQELLARGGDAAVHRSVLTGKTEFSDVLLFGTRAQLGALSEKLEWQPFGLAQLGLDLARLLAKLELWQYEWRHAGGAMRLAADSPKVMAILNMTPDSFSGDGLAGNVDAALARAEAALSAGADLLDVGGESTRPGSPRIPLEEELARIIPTIAALSHRFEASVSVDTYKPEVARAALEAGAVIVNCVRGLEEPGMLELVANTGAGAVCMHSLWPPETMQESPLGPEVSDVVFEYLSGRLDAACEAGLAPEQLVFDPGIGFGKTPQANLLLLKRLGELRSLGRPLLVGASRKSFLGKLAGDIDADRLPGTLAAHTAAILNGASIIRAHDAAEGRLAADIAAAIGRA